MFDVGYVLVKNGFVEAELLVVLDGHLVHALLDVAADLGLLEQALPDGVFASQARRDEIQRGGHPNEDEEHPNSFQDIVNPHLAFQSPSVRTLWRLENHTEPKGVAVKQAIGRSLTFSMAV